MLRIYAMEHYSAIKEWENPATCNNMDGYGTHHAKWNKSDRERQKYSQISMISPVNLKQTNKKTPAKLIEIEVRFVVSRGRLGEEESEEGC